MGASSTTVAGSDGRQRGIVEGGLERGQVDERLERASGLALGGGGAVVLALRVVAPADQGHDRARGGLERDEGALDGRMLLPPHHLVHLGQALAQDVLGLGLQREVERRVDGEVLGGEVLRVVALRELLLDEVDEVRRVRAVQGGALDAHGLGDGRLRRGRVHEPRLLHRAQHEVAALGRALGVAVGVVGIGGLDHAREKRRLRRG